MRRTGVEHHLGAAPEYHSARGARHVACVSKARRANTGRRTRNRKPAPAHATPASAADQNAVIKRYCVGCHNDKRKDNSGGLSLETFDVAKVADHADVGERMIRKLQAGMMPPPGATRPDARRLRRARQRARNADRRRGGARPESRVAHVPAAQSRRVRARDQRPARARRGRRQLAAARHEERELRQHRRRAGAVADAARGVPERGRRHQPHGGRRPQRRAAIDHTYTNAGYVSQHPWDHVEGAPYGTRGGMVVDHVFPADGEYVFEVTLNARRQRALRGHRHLDRRRARRAAQYETGPAGGADGRGAVPIRTEPIVVKARAAARRGRLRAPLDGPYEDLIRPHDWSFAGGGSGGGGITTLPHLRDLIIRGPFKTTGRLGDAEPPEDLHLPADVAGRRAAVRARDRHAARRRGVPASAAAARSRSPDAVLREGRRRPTASRAASARRSRRSSPARTSSSASSASPTAASRARPIASPTSTSRRGSRSSSGARRRTRSC